MLNISLKEIEFLEEKVRNTWLKTDNSGHKKDLEKLIRIKKYLVTNKYVK